MYLRVVALLVLGCCGLFGDNDYCVRCRNGQVKKCHSDIGGEVGMVECGVRNPGCSISYFDGRYCRVTHAAVNTAEVDAFSSLKETDDLTVTMPKGEWEKLVKRLGGTLPEGAPKNDKK